MEPSAANLLQQTTMNAIDESQVKPKSKRQFFLACILIICTFIMMITQAVLNRLEKLIEKLTTSDNAWDRVTELIAMYTNNTSDKCK